MGKLGTVYKAKNLKTQLERENEVNEKLAAAIEKQDLMTLRRTIHEARALPTPLKSESLDRAIKLERELTNINRLVKEGKAAITSGDMDEVKSWQRKFQKQKKAKRGE